MSTKAMIALATLASVIGMGGASAAADSSQPAKPAPPQSVTVKSGDNLSEIAQSYSTTYVRLYDDNANINNPSLIYPGEVVQIPAADQQLPDRPLPVASPVTPAVTPVSESASAEETSVPASTPAPVVSSAGNGVWDSLAACESGGNWAAATGNGFYGGLQFTLSSWQAVGGSGYPNQASPSEQIARAQMLEARQGWSAWPACSSKLGL